MSDIEESGHRANEEHAERRTSTAPPESDSCAWAAVGLIAGLAAIGYGGYKACDTIAGAELTPTQVVNYYQTEILHDSTSYPSESMGSVSPASVPQELVETAGHLVLLDMAAV